jgi:cytochrome b561
MTTYGCTLPDGACPLSLTPIQIEMAVGLVMLLLALLRGFWLVARGRSLGAGMAFTIGTALVIVAFGLGLTACGGPRIGSGMTVIEAGVYVGFGLMLASIVYAWWRARTRTNQGIQKGPTYEGRSLGGH